MRHWDGEGVVLPLYKGEGTLDPTGTLDKTVYFTSSSPQHIKGSDPEVEPSADGTLYRVRHPLSVDLSSDFCEPCKVRTGLSLDLRRVTHSGRLQCTSFSWSVESGQV